MTIINKNLSFSAAFCAGLLISGAASAADMNAPVKKTEPAAPAAAATPDYDLAVSMRGVSDYNFRGISQTARKPSVQASAEFTYKFFYAGIAGYTVDLATKPKAEIDYLVGIRPKLGDFTFDFGTIWYVYPRERQLIAPANTYWTPKNTDFTEYAAKVSWTGLEDKLTLGAGAFHAPDWLGTGSRGTYFNTTAKYLLPQGFAVSGELGHYTFGKNSAYLGGFKLPDYTYWNAGLSYTYKAVTIDGRYHATSLGNKSCFLLTSDPRGVTSGNAGGMYKSNWCGNTFIASLSIDLTAQGLGIFK